MTAVLRLVSCFVLQVTVCQMQDYKQAEIGCPLNLFSREWIY